ncbi:hypothetical protein [Clostridium sp.]|uniref:hypothetical protein n=1 Tax=Clostridium sp. TaxID=1506 RepID=UPI00260188F0|nr:hypothetical protein [Clostridium sp.]
MITFDGQKKNKIIIEKNNLYNIVSLLLYKISLDILYAYVISPIYAYKGFGFKPKLYKYLISTFFFILMIKPIIKKYSKGKPSSLIILLLNLIYFIPGCTLYALADLSDIYFLWFSLYWITLMICERMFPIIPIKIKKGKFKNLIFYFIVILIVIVTIFITGYYNGFNFHFGLSDVYTLRLDQRAMNLPVIVGYIQPLAAVVLPVAFVYFLIEKRVFLSILLILTQLLLFSFGGSKFTFFAIVIAYLSYLFYNKTKDKYIIWGLIVLNIMAIVEAYFNNHISYIASYVQIRNFFTTNLLSFQYYDFFEKNEFLLLRASILNKLSFKNPYGVSIPRLIGLTYYGSFENNANNGLVGDAFSNFGWVGIVIYPLIIVLLLRVLDSCSKGIDAKVLVSVCIIYAMLLTNASLFTLLLTNGFMFMCIFLFYYPRIKS